jgi:tyrosine-protein phosphatase SIW14
MTRSGSVPLYITRRSVFLSLCASFWAAAASLPPVAHVPNFSQVDSHLYRGGQPTPVGIQELGAMGIKLIIDLRESGQRAEFENELAKKLGIKYVNIPFAELSAPSNQQISTVLSLIQHESGPIFVHCWRGKDRTGTVVACYRIQHDGWDNQRALAEAKEHGMSYFERGMRSYVLHFTPVSVAELARPVQ